MNGKELDKLKSEFLFRISGELRRPLTQIQGTIDSLAATLPKEVAANRKGKNPDCTGASYPTF
ncbi:MAG: hypothetical protein ACE5IT_07235 [bacterium]